MTLTVLARIAGDNGGLGSQTEVVGRLDFDVVGREGVRVVDVVPQPLGGGVLPLLPGVSPPATTPGTSGEAHSTPGTSAAGHVRTSPWGGGGGGGGNRVKW